MCRETHRSETRQQRIRNSLENIAYEKLSTSMTLSGQSYRTHKLEFPYISKKWVGTGLEMDWPTTA